MRFIELEKDGKLYKAEHFADDETVTISGKDGSAEVVDIHGLTGLRLPVLPSEILSERVTSVQIKKH